MAQYYPSRSHIIHSRACSFSRVDGRLHSVQTEALARLGPHYMVDMPRADAVRTVSPSSCLDPEKVSGHAGQVWPLVVEVGSGSGEALLIRVTVHPRMDYLAMEAWETAIACLVISIRHRGLHNVCVVPVDASQLLATALLVSYTSEVWVSFPGLWHKSQHRKCRLVTMAFTDSVAWVLYPSGVRRLATDWADYAWQIRDIIEAMAVLPAGLRPDITLLYFRRDDAGTRPDLGAETIEEDSPGSDLDPGSPASMCDGWSPRYERWIMVRFGQRGLDVRRMIRGLTAIRTEATWIPGRGASMLDHLEIEGQAWNHVKSQS